MSFGYFRLIDVTMHNKQHKLNNALSFPSIYNDVLFHYQHHL